MLTFFFKKTIKYQNKLGCNKGKAHTNCFFLKKNIYVEYRNTKTNVGLKTKYLH